ncbi:GNAT family N-acetyltransferase [Salinirubellus salinus]|uniref:GNAT family N-acetyltransferase n=1 Tax=Salinirubellus salinus TaxID=1364945 RepID=A0A9E7R5C5_9EURY|nr:GNAT family N-acetyltransferase [Salinirubellus salinus]UWM55751.1 GNAT family N-acetyltransferase [Salinirubellus salinus]
MSVDVRVVETDAELNACIDLRRSVFVEEQDVPEDRELDGLDGEATHLLAWDGYPVGTARIRDYGADDDGRRVAKVERVAVEASRRGEGIGRDLMAHAEAFATDEGYDRVRLDAQVPVVAFYERLGYTGTSEEFEDAGIPHRTMEKALGGDRAV